MQIPETPKNVGDLDLMKKLDQYAQGKASWLEGETKLGQEAKKECHELYTSIVKLVDKAFSWMLSRSTAHEMETFTVHDVSHGHKVAHLMWHILKPERRELLTPPEIGMLVVSAYLHDLGMVLNSEDRQKRLDPESDMWHKLEIQEPQRATFDQLRKQYEDPELSDFQKKRARQLLHQAEEALLCQDTRERHAYRERYEQLLTQLQQYHEDDRAKLPDIESCLSYQGDSFKEKLIEICVSHGKDTTFLIENDDNQPERPRFPANYVLGECQNDLLMVASALRLADILDFDRERTPSVLFYYLLPPSHTAQNDRSVLE